LQLRGICMDQLAYRNLASFNTFFTLLLILYQVPDTIQPNPFPIPAFLPFPSTDLIDPPIHTPVLQSRRSFPPLQTRKIWGFPDPDGCGGDQEPRNRLQTSRWQSGSRKTSYPNSLPLRRAESSEMGSFGELWDLYGGAEALAVGH
jgi:hypothetical protein